MLNSIKRPLISLFKFIKSIYQHLYIYSPINFYQILKHQKLDTIKLNIGCGKAKIKGWTNIDIEPGADIVLDLRKKLPFKNNSVDLIYSEHVIEHFPHDQGAKILKEFNRCLKTNGVLRIAMPDLDFIVSKYIAGWKDQEWLNTHGFIKSKGQMINACFKLWGHKFLYNEEDINAQLLDAGFSNILRFNKNISNNKELVNLETRDDSKLIMEAIKK